MHLWTDAGFSSCDYQLCMIAGAHRKRCQDFSAVMSVVYVLLSETERER